ncbi:MAG: sigma-70 family RNA polymerase sigma factor [Usitatibacter sp.]
MSASTSTKTSTANGSDFACIAAAWQAHHAELLGYLTHRLSDAAIADDMLHDVFVKAMRQGQGFCVLDNPRAWLFQVARNALVDRTRAAHPAEPLPDGADELAAPEPQTPAPVDDLANCVSRCLGELTDEDAAILRACDLDGQTTRAFADTHELTLAAAKSRLLRARQRLRAQLITVCQVRFGDNGNVDGHLPRGGL